MTTDLPLAFQLRPTRIQKPAWVVLVLGLFLLSITSIAPLNAQPVSKKSRHSAPLPRENSKSATDEMDVARRPDVNDAEQTSSVKNPTTTVKLDTLYPISTLFQKQKFTYQLITQEYITNENDYFLDVKLDTCYLIFFSNRGGKCI